MAEIELHPDTTFCDVATLNRLARQQQLGASIARASIYDEICQAVAISEDDSAALVRMFLEREGLDPNQPDALERWLRSKGWTQEDLRYISSRWERIERFQTQVFAEEVERQFLSRKLAHDQVTYSMIRVRDGDLAFELHQRLLDEEASFTLQAWDLVNFFSLSIVSLNIFCYILFGNIFCYPCMPRCMRLFFLCRAC